MHGSEPAGVRYVRAHKPTRMRTLTRVRHIYGEFAKQTRQGYEAE